MAIEKDIHKCQGSQIIKKNRMWLTDILKQRHNDDASYREGRNTKTKLSQKTSSGNMEGNEFWREINLGLRSTSASWLIYNVGRIIWWADPIISSFVKWVWSVLVTEASGELIYEMTNMSSCYHLYLCLEENYFWMENPKLFLHSEVKMSEFSILKFCRDCFP